MPKLYNADVFSTLKLVSVSIIGASVRGNALLFKEGRLLD